MGGGTDIPLLGAHLQASTAGRHYGDHGLKPGINVLLFCGLIVIALDLLIAHTAYVIEELQRTWPLLASIFTCLHAVETSAFLSAVGCFRWALREPAEARWPDMSADGGERRVALTAAASVEASYHTR